MHLENRAGAGAPSVSQPQGRTATRMGLSTDAGLRAAIRSRSISAPHASTPEDPFSKRRSRRSGGGGRRCNAFYRHDPRRALTAGRHSEDSFVVHAAGPAPARAKRVGS